MLKTQETARTECDECNEMNIQEDMINLHYDSNVENNDVKEQYIDYDGMVCQECFENKFKKVENKMPNTVNTMKKEFVGVQKDQFGAWAYACQPCVDELKIEKEFLRTGDVCKDTLCDREDCMNHAVYVFETNPEQVLGNIRNIVKEKIMPVGSMKGEYAYKMGDDLLVTDADSDIIEATIKLVKTAYEGFYTMEDFENILKALDIKYFILTYDNIQKTSW